jgi:hypothetical protein
LPRVVVQATGHEGEAARAGLQAGYRWPRIGLGRGLGLIAPHARRASTAAGGPAWIPKASSAAVASPRRQSRHRPQQALCTQGGPLEPLSPGGSRIGTWPERWAGHRSDGMCRKRHRAVPDPGKAAGVRSPVSRQHAAKRSTPRGPMACRREHLRPPVRIRRMNAIEVGAATPCLVGTRAPAPCGVARGFAWLEERLARGALRQPERRGLAGPVAPAVIAPGVARMRKKANIRKQQCDGSSNFIFVLTARERPKVDRVGAGFHQRSRFRPG